MCLYLPVVFGLHNRTDDRGMGRYSARDGLKTEEIRRGEICELITSNSKYKLCIICVALGVVSYVGSHKKRIVFSLFVSHHPPAPQKHGI